MLREVLKKLAIGYIRVSTKSQENDGDSLQHQAANIRDYSFRKGFTLAGIYEEVASATSRKPGSRPVFLDGLKAVQREDAVLIVTNVDRLSRSQKEVNELIVVPGIPVHVVSLNRQVGKTKLLILAKQAEAEGVKISRDTKTALSNTKARGVRLGAPKSVLEQATRSSTRQGAIAAWNTVTEIVRFMLADPLRRDMTKRDLVGALNAAGFKTTRGNIWTMGRLTRPLRQAKADLQLQDEPDDGPAGFDEVVLAT